MVQYQINNSYFGISAPYHCKIIIKSQLPYPSSHLIAENKLSLDFGFTNISFLNFNLVLWGLNPFLSSYILGIEILFILFSDNIQDCGRSQDDHTADSDFGRALPRSIMCRYLWEKKLFKNTNFIMQVQLSLFITCWTYFFFFINFELNKIL